MDPLGVYTAKGQATLLSGIIHY